MLSPLFCILQKGGKVRMAKTKRFRQKKTGALVYNNLERAAEHMNKLHNQISETHSELKDLAGFIIQSILVTQDLVKRFWEHSWGPFPPDVEKWRDR